MERFVFALAAALAAAPALAADPGPHNDFDGDGHSDLLWRNARTGSNVIWRNALSTHPLPVKRVANTDWQIAGTSDFDLDRRADLLWRNRATGLVVIWYAAAASTGEPLSLDWSRVGGYSTQWQIAGIGDFSGNGRPQIVWRNRVTGSNAMASYDWFDGFGYLVDKTNRVANMAWQVAGVGDFDGDKRSEILWRNTTSGANVLWQVSPDTGLFAGVALPIVAPVWEVAGVDDFNGDGKSDILWRNTSTGANALWYSGKYTTAKALFAVTDMRWQVTATGDFDGDGMSDVFWRNAGTGANAIWRSADHDTPMAVTGVANPDWATVK